MKKIEAIIRNTQFEQIRDALADIGVQFFTVREVQGYGLQKSEKLIYRGANHGVDFIARLQMEIVAVDDMIDPIVGAIEQAGRTGEVGDGKIFVSDVLSVIRIRTGERDELAI